ncbi:fibronectin-binding protein [Streptococcus pyogenes]|nr:serum opacification factor [Streptococcus pyogenes]VHM67149.1 fibronectin-binding protein [Streptococcus pyogenes]
MTNCKYKLRKLSVGLVSVGTMLIAPTVLGQEVSNTEASASSTASVDATASGTTASGASSEATVATTNGGSQSTQVAAETTPQPQVQTSEQPAATSTSLASSTSSSEDKAPKAASTKSSSATVASSSNGSNQGAGTEVEPQMMDVEQYKVNKEKTELTVKDDNQQLKIRKDVDELKNKDLFDVKREVKDNGDGTLDVTLKVTPKQIDEGADVMALLDVSQKMTDADFNNAKEKIKKLVKTLTSKPTDSHPNHNARNSVRLMTFYREVSDPIDISGKTDEELNKILDDVWQNAKHNWDWGVDLQGAIHKARGIFKQDQEKKSGKRQHIVLFSQGESTFSYDIQKSEKERDNNLSRINEKITSSNPLLHWPPIFNHTHQNADNHTHQNADMLNEIERIIKIGEQLGIKGLSSIKGYLSTAAAGSGILGNFIGGGSLTEYLTLKEYNSDKLEESQFDYTKRVGEGYYYYSFSKRVSHNDFPFKTLIEQAITQAIPTKGESKNWFEKFLDKFSLVESYRDTQKKALLKILEYLFYKREYHYYNHNLSAIAEAKMAQQEGITFYSVDVTDSETTPKRVRRQTAVRQEKAKKESKEERNEKFDKYLKKMSEGNTFLDSVEEKDKFKDTFTNVTVTETFEDKVSAIANSWESSLDSHNNKSDRNHKGSVKHTQAQSSGWFANTQESLTWTISKDQLKKAFEDGEPLTLTYKLKVDKDKFRETLKKQQERNRKNEQHLRKVRTLSQKKLFQIRFLTRLIMVRI